MRFCKFHILLFSFLCFEKFWHFTCLGKQQQQRLYSRKTQPRYTLQQLGWALLTYFGFTRVEVHFLTCLTLDFYLLYLTFSLICPICQFNCLAIFLSHLTHFHAYSPLTPPPTALSKISCLKTNTPNTFKPYFPLFLSPPCFLPFL